MGTPMKTLRDYLENFFTEEAYVEAKYNDAIAGVVINEELFKKLQEYLELTHQTIVTISSNDDKTDVYYTEQIEKANNQIKKINSQIARINEARNVSNNIDIDSILNNILNAFTSIQPMLEVKSPYRRTDKDGKPIGGNLSTISDPNLGINRGGIITPVNDGVDYTGKYAKIDSINDLLNGVVGNIQQIEQKFIQEELPEINEIIATKMSEEAKKTVKENNNLTGTKVTQKTFLRKRVVPIMFALEMAALIAVVALRGTNVSISGAHGNYKNVTGVEEQIKDSQTEYEKIYEKLGIDLQRKLEEQKTLNEFKGDPALKAEERKLGEQEVLERFLEEENKILSQNSNGEDISVDNLLQQYELLIKQNEQIISAYKEDSKNLQGIIDSNQEHINISDGTKSPNSSQEGLVGSLNESDIKRHETEIRSAQNSLNSNLKSIENCEQKIEEAQKRINFIKLLKQQNGFNRVTDGNDENVFESLYQMYSKRSEQTSMEDFMGLIADNDYDLNAMAEYAKEEFSDLTLEQSLSKFELIDQSYKVYISEYGLNSSQVDISAYTQYANQYIKDNPEIGKYGGFFTIAQGQISQNDMNSGFYNYRQENATKEGVIRRIFRNIRTIFDTQRKSKYEEAANKQTRAMEDAMKGIETNEKE